jgi:hypothetical protein
MAEPLPSNAVAIATEIAGLESAMTDRAAWFGPGGAEKQQRYVALRDAQAAGAAAPAREDAQSVEKREIEAAMGDRNSQYWRGPKGPDGETAMAARYRDILEGRAAPQDRAPTTADVTAQAPASPAGTMTIAEAKQALAPAVVDALSINGEAQFEARLVRVGSMIATIESNIGAEAAQQFESVLDGLPHKVQAAIALVVGDAPSPGDMRDWGTRATDKFKRIVASLDGSDLAAFDHFWKNSPEHERDAMLWSLGHN